MKSEREKKCAQYSVTYNISAFCVKYFLKIYFVQFMINSIRNQLACSVNETTCNDTLVLL